MLSSFFPRRSLGRYHKRRKNGAQQEFRHFYSEDLERKKTTLHREWRATIGFGRHMTIWTHSIPFSQSYNPFYALLRHTHTHTSSTRHFHAIYRPLFRKTKTKLFLLYFRTAIQTKHTLFDLIFNDESTIHVDFHRTPFTCPNENPINYTVQ